MRSWLQTERRLSWEICRDLRSAWTFQNDENGKASKIGSLLDRLAAHVRKFRVKFVAGDFNMALTEVCKQLGNRGIVCDCVAWYPWKHVPQATTLGTQAVVADLVAAKEQDIGRNGQRLGFDSCGIFLHWR